MIFVIDNKAIDYTKVTEEHRRRTEYMYSTFEEPSYTEGTVVRCQEFWQNSWDCIYSVFQGGTVSQWEKDVQFYRELPELDAQAVLSLVPEEYRSNKDLAASKPPLRESSGDSLAIVDSSISLEKTHGGSVLDVRLFAFDKVIADLLPKAFRDLRTPFGAILETRPHTASHIHSERRMFGINVPITKAEPSHIEFLPGEVTHVLTCPTLYNVGALHRVVNDSDVPRRTLSIAWQRGWSTKEPVMTFNQMLRKLEE